jgi:hypothetical protein
MFGVMVPEIYPVVRSKAREFISRPPFNGASATAFDAEFPTDGTGIYKTFFVNCWRKGVNLGMQVHHDSGRYCSVLSL